MSAPSNASIAKVIGCLKGNILPYISLKGASASSVSKKLPFSHCHGKCYLPGAFFSVVKITVIAPCQENPAASAPMGLWGLKKMKPMIDPIIAQMQKFARL